MLRFDPVALLEARAKRGLTQAELATAAGVSSSMITRYERGVCAPRATTAFRMAEALGVLRTDFYIDDNMEVQLCQGETPRRR